MSHKIVLIDDDVDFVEINKTILQKAGYEVDTAYDGEEGIKKIEAFKPALVILDVMMKTADEGFHVARKIRETEATKELPILMLSSMNKMEGQEWQLGPSDKWNPIDQFVDKPVKPEVLLEKVKNLINS
ncbi:response regulator [bacterium]|nr:response regulator [bacterium]